MGTHTHTHTHAHSHSHTHLHTHTHTHARAHAYAASRCACACACDCACLPLACNAITRHSRLRIMGLALTLRLGCAQRPRSLVSGLYLLSSKNAGGSSPP